MGTITLPNFRTTADVTMNTRLKDGGVAIDWAGLSNIKAWLYSDAQKAIAGRCDVSIDQTDNTKLVCEYSATRPQYLGVQRLIIQAKYMGRTKTYDKPVFNFVRWTDDQAGEEITMEDPEVDVEIVAEDMSSSILDEATAAALVAAAAAEHAASLVPLQVLQDCEAATAVALTAASKAPVIGENGNWWVWNSQQAAYVDTGKQAKGDTGNGIASFSVVESQEDDADNVVTVTFTDGTTETFNVKNGKTGNGIASIVQTVESPDDAGTNVITVTMTNGTVITFNVKNGSKGQPGAAQAAYKSVETLPTATAETMDKIYLTPSGTSGVYNMSYTDYDGSAYSWVSLGTTAIQLSDYATKAEVGQLEAKVDGTPRNYTPGYGLKSDGTLQESSYWGVTDYIPYTPGNDVLWRFSNQNRSYYLLFYRSDKTFISGSDFSAQYNATNQGRLIAKASINTYAPNAAYIRASFNLDYADAQVKVGDTVVWTPQEQGLSLQEQIDALAEFNEDIFATCLVEQIKLVGVYYQGKYIYKGDHSINDSASNGSFVVPVSTGDRILVRGTVNAMANYTVVGFTDNLTNGYTAGVKNLLTVDSNTNPYTYTYLFTATSNGYLVAWTTKRGYGDSLYVEMFRIKERQKEVFDRYLPESVKLQTFGDSITDNFWGDKSSWVSYAPDNIKNTELTIINSAVGGASIGGTGSYNIPNQIENGYTRTDGSVAVPLDATADIVVIFAGTNDWAAGQELASTLGNLATAFQYIYEHSKAKVLFCTPLQRYNETDAGFNTDENGVPVNPNGMTLRQLCDELIKVCKRFSVPVLDLNAEANINRYNISDYSLDGLHPQRWGDAYVSRLICEKIKAMLRYDLQ